MKNDDKLPSLDTLQAKIDAVKQSRKIAYRASTRADMSGAVRLLIDLATGVIVGVGMGYLLDNWLGLTPLFMVIGLFFGMIAGVKNMLHSAKLIDKELVVEELGKRQTDENVIGTDKNYE